MFETYTTLINPETFLIDVQDFDEFIKPFNDYKIPFALDIDHGVAIIKIPFWHRKPAQMAAEIGNLTLNLINLGQNGETKRSVIIVANPLMNTLEKGVQQEDVAK